MIKDIISQHIRIGNSLFQQINQIENICLLCLNVIKAGNKIILCGNGGSATDSSHIAA
ncbi:MAG: SIS domain-containing protein [Hydrogenophilales bacterium]